MPEKHTEFPTLDGGRAVVAGEVDKWTPPRWDEMPAATRALLLSFGRATDPSDRRRIALRIASTMPGSELIATPRVAAQMRALEDALAALAEEIALPHELPMRVARADHGRAAEACAEAFCDAFARLLDLVADQQTRERLAMAPRKSIHLGLVHVAPPRSYAGFFESLPRQMSSDSLSGASLEATRRAETLPAPAPEDAP